MRRRSSPAAAPPLLLLLLFLLLAYLGDIARFASAQSDDDEPSSFDDGGGDEAQEFSSSLPLSMPSIDDLAPGAVLSTFRGSPRWKFLPDLFVRRTALVECEGGQDFRVFVARDAARLAQAVASVSPPVWCGWRRAAARAARGALRGGGGGGKGPGGGGGLSGAASRLFGGLLSPSSSSSSSSSSSRSPLLPPCEARLPTFGPSAVAVVPRGGGTGTFCTIEATSRLDPTLAARLGLGAALFLLAPSLAASTSFRVSAGAVSFALASLLVVLFLVARAVPNKRQLAVAAAAMGSGVLTIARLLFGHWVPTLSELASAKVLGSYAACSLAVGAAVAFWFDDPQAEKAHAILAAALRLAGLGLVAGGVASPVAGFSLAVALALVVFAGPRVAGPWAEMMERKRKAEAAEEQQRRRATAAAGSPPRRQASPLLFQQQQQQQLSPEAAALHQRRGRSASVSTASFESPERSSFPLASSPQRATSRGGGEEEEIQGGVSESGRALSVAAAAPVLSFLGRGRSPAAAAAASFPAPAVSAPPPPLLFSSAAAVPLPSAHEEEEQERDGGGESADRRTTTTSEFRPSQQQQQQQSGWQREEPQQQRSAGRSRSLVTSSTPARSLQRPQQQQQQSDSRAADSAALSSPLIARGLMLNEATGKTIKIGGDTYNRLVMEGYTVDEANGTLSPPARGARRGRTGGGGGAGASNLRPRTRHG